MKYLKILLILAVGYILTNCSNCKNLNDNSDKTFTRFDKSPNVIQQNLSLVNAEIINVENLESETYRLTARVISVEETESLPSIAVSGAEYILIPGYQYDGERLLDNDVNKSLLELKTKPVGTRFNAEISLDNKLGWVIQKVNN